MAEARESIFQQPAPRAEEVVIDEQTVQELQRMLAIDVRQLDDAGTMVQASCCGIDKQPL